MNKEDDTLIKLQGLLRTAESNLKGKSVMSTPTTTSASVLAIGHGKGKKRKAPSKSRKGNSLDGSSSSRTKAHSVNPSSNLKYADSFQCHEKGTRNGAAPSTCRT